MNTRNQVYAVQAFKPCHKTKKMLLAKLEMRETLAEAQALFDTWYAEDKELKPDFMLIWAQ